MLKVNEFITTTQTSVSIPDDDFDAVCEEILERTTEPTDDLRALMQSKAPWE